MAFSLLAKNFNKNVASHLNPRVVSLRQYCAATSTKVAKKVEYPPIQDISQKAEDERKKMAWHEAVKGVKTIEEKLIKVNMPAYWGLRTTPLENDEYHYNCFPYFQHWTRSLYENGLPNAWLKRSAEEIDGIVNNIREQIIESISFQYQGFR